MNSAFEALISSTIVASPFAGPSPPLPRCVSDTRANANNGFAGSSAAEPKAPIAGRAAASHDRKTLRRNLKRHLLLFVARECG